MYPIMLAVHSALRWIVVITAVAAVARAVHGWLSQREWTTSDRWWGILFSSGMDLQALLGFILYGFLSPMSRAALRDVGAALSDPTLRYWGIEHIGLMAVALGLVHAGRALSERASRASAQHRRAAMFFTLATLLIVSATPWPFLPHGRPLLRWG
jgi:hypothetical protein